MLFPRPPSRATFAHTPCTNSWPVTRPRGFVRVSLGNGYWELYLAWILAFSTLAFLERGIAKDMRVRVPWAYPCACFASVHCRESLSRNPVSKGSPVSSRPTHVYPTRSRDTYGTDWRARGNRAITRQSDSSQKLSRGDSWRDV